MEFDEFQRKQHEYNFPPSRKLSIHGIAHQQSPTGPEQIVSIGGIDPEGKWSFFWMDLPNAMYLMRLLSVVQKRTGADVPREAPDPLNEKT